MAPLDISWDSVKENGPALLADSRVGVRVPPIQAISAALADAGPELASDKQTLQKLALSIFNTYSYYQDARSRSTALQAVVDFVRFDESYLRFFVNSIHEVAGKSSNMAVTNVLTLLSWINEILVFVNTKGTGGSQGNSESLADKIGESQMLLLDSAVKCGDRSQPQAGVSRKSHGARTTQSGVTQTKHALVRVLGQLDQKSQQAYLSGAVKRAVSAKLPVQAALLFLAVLADALHDMLPVEPCLFEYVQSSGLGTQILSFYTAQAILAKEPPSAFVLALFSRAYLANYVSKDQFSTEVLPNVEKAIMRSSEVGLCHITRSIFESKDCIDLSAVFASSNLLTHVLNGLKASKENVRLSANVTMSLIFFNALPQISDDDLCKIIGEISKTYKLTSSAESKVLLASAYGCIRDSSERVSGELLTSLLPLVSKEQNEQILSELASVFSSAYLHVLCHNWTLANEADIAKQFKVGLESPKVPLRSVWAARVGSQLLSTSSFAERPRARDFLQSIYPSMMKSLAEANKSPLLTVSNKGIVSAYVCIALSSLLDTSAVNIQQVFADSLDTSKDKFSILTSPKVISKLAGEEHFWCLKALVASFQHSKEHPEFGLAFLSLALSSYVDHSTRIETVKQIATLMTVDEQQASSFLVKAIQTVVEGKQQSDSAEAELSLNVKFLSPVFESIMQLPSKETSIANLIGLFVVAHHPQIPIKDSWIGLVLRASLDPNAVLQEHASELIEIILDTMETTKINGMLYKAACAALNTIAFINADVVQPRIAGALKADLSIDSLEDIDETAIRIWKAEEGELIVDILSHDKPKQVAHKNTKDFETRKWEETLQKEISAKKGTQKKLTREEQTQVNIQLAKEAELRSKINSLVKRYQRAFYIIRTLCSSKCSISTGGCDWYFTAVFDLLKLLKHPRSVDLFGSLGTETFIKASNVCSDRLHPLEEITGAVTLRLLNIKGIPANFTETPLLETLSNVLFRIKIVMDDWFHLNGLIYISPLILEVLNVGKAVAMKNSRKQVTLSEFSDEDPEEEHLSLALSILSSLDMLQDKRMPRVPILESIIALMRIPSKAKMAKECFLTICQQISVNFTQADIDVLFQNLITPDVFVKNAILQGIDAEFDLSEEMQFSEQIFIVKHDNDSNIAELANTIYDDSSFKLPSDWLTKLLPYTDNGDSGLRLTIAKSITSGVKISKDAGRNEFETTLEALLNLYCEKENPPPPPKDKFGLVINKHALQKDPWEARSSVALTLKFLSPFFKTKSAIETIFEFLVTKENLGDKEPLVAQELLEAGTEVIKESGSDFVEVLIPIFEDCLAQEDKGSKKQDRIKESVIILYGSLGRHLKASDSRLQIIFDRLMQTLDTPSEDVQYAVSECIAPLTKAFESTLQDRFDELFEKLWSGKSLAVRKGAAYGIAGLVKGSGIKSLYAYDVMRNLTTASEDKKNEAVREGVAYAIDCLSQSLGPLFEPYVIEILPIILKYLGDSSPQVREATDYASRQIMKSTTSYGVKQLIPLAIRNLDDIAWRSKKGSVELLGSMAYLDPTQLSASLSTIVPEIVGVLNDSHKEVRRAADQSLKRFGEVIRNPEIQAIVPDLIKAIGDPTKYTDDALDKLIKTQFVHYIDGPSLALIIHVIHRGMRERSAATKKKACQIVGNMAILVDSKDLLPYLPSLVSELEIAMVDPVPETRSTGARALGSLIEKLGEEQLPDLIPRLIDTLNDPSKAGDRLGSAQALAEVICGLGLSKLDEMLPSILASAQSPYGHVRAGFMPLLLYLPVCFGSQFAPYLSKIIPPILQGLAESDEEIRETALKAGRLLVKNYASKAVDLLLPELEQGLSDSSYRIRLSSVELTGDLLFQVTGISGKNELSEEQVEVNKNLVEVLGQERRDRILAALYICRSDVTSVVRAGAIDIWKALVANTPRTVKEIIPSLTQMLVKRLASSDESHRAIAAATLGDVVRRVGANALSQLLPTLEELLISSDSDAKQGICIALTELINSASVEALTNFQGTFTNIIRNALIDPSAEVREAAAQAFDALQEQMGKSVVDDILPYLLNLLESDNSENALLALQDIMAAKSDVIFPILIPSLMTPPIDAFKAKALSSLASVAGPALYSRLASIINTLLQAVIDTKKTGSPEEVQEVENAFDKTLLSIDSDAGVHPVMQQLMSLVKNQDPEKRAAICERLAVFFEQTNLDYSLYVSDMVSQLIFYLGDSDPAVVNGVFNALLSLVKAQDKQMLEQLVKPAHQALLIAGVRGEDLAGLALPRGPSCILPIFSHGLMYGNSEQKELSALSIAEIIDRTPAASLKPFATPLTGPLIRVIGEKVSSDIKSAILAALTNLLKRIPQFLRPFIPQLQRTFVRSLSDPTNEKLRSGAVDALGLLIEFQPRVDSLVTELVTGAKISTDQSIKNALLRAMLQVVLKGGRNMSEASKTSIMALIEVELSTVNDKSAVSYARLLGSLSQILSKEEAASILKNKILSKRSDEAELKFAVLSINSFLRDSPVHVFNTDLLDEIIEFIVSCSNVNSPYISDNAAVAIGKLLLLDGESRSPKQEGSQSYDGEFTIPEESRSLLVEQLCKLALQPISGSSDTRRLSLVSIRTVARFKHKTFIKPYYDVLAPTVFSCLRDAVIPIRLAAEKAYLAIFKLVTDINQNLFSTWFENASKGTITTIFGSQIQPRSIGDYTKRVASRLASVERERIEAGGDNETMFSDRIEDENEVWAVGGF